MYKTVAYLGPGITNSRLAAEARFGKKTKYVSALTIDEVFHLVEREKAELGVVPIENTLGGAVVHTLDRFIEFKQSPVRIHGEFERPIQHHLIVRRNADPSRIRVVFSHPQVIAQCRHWLEHNLPKVTIMESHSTSHAVQHLITTRFKTRFKTRWKLIETAAIGPRTLASRYGLRAIRIPQERENRTRFLLLGLGNARRGKMNKTSLLLSLKDRPGALYSVLAPIKRQGINLTRIESRRSARRTREYYFFIDFEGYESDMKVRRVLRVLKNKTAFMKVLGSYSVRSAS